MFRRIQQNIVEHPSDTKKIPVWAVRLSSRTLNSKKEFKKYFESGLANIKDRR